MHFFKISLVLHLLRRVSGQGMDKCSDCSNLVIRKKCHRCRNQYRLNRKIEVKNQKILEIRSALPITFCENCQTAKIKDLCSVCFKNYKRHKKAESRAKNRNKGKFHEMN